jgi:DNA-binding NarL/FixJ family response regulator
MNPIFMGVLLPDASHAPPCTDMDRARCNGAGGAGQCTVEAPVKPFLLLVRNLHWCNPSNLYTRRTTLMDDQTRSIKVFLLDSHEAARSALRRLLVVEGFDVAGESASMPHALAMMVQQAPDIVLMETQGLGVNPLQACRDMRSALPGTRVIFLAESADITMRVRAILAGADGYLSKDASVAQLVRTIRTVVSGNHIIDTETLQWLREKASTAVGGSMPTQVLSPQEKKIVPLVAEGLTNKQIGEALGLSHKTVKNHLSNVFQKLQVSRRSQLAAIVAGAVQ